MLHIISVARQRAIEGFYCLFLVSSQKQKKKKIPGSFIYNSFSQSLIFTLMEIFFNFFLLNFFR